MNSPFVFQDKLEHDFKVLTDTNEDAKVRTFSLLDFCTTARHLAERVWKYPATQKKLQAKGFSSKDQYWEYLKGRCLELKICLELTNEYKHYVDTSGKKVVERLEQHRRVGISRISGTRIGPGTKFGGSRLGGAAKIGGIHVAWHPDCPTFQQIVLSDGKKVESHKVAETVKGFWIAELDSLK